MITGGSSMAALRRRLRTGDDLQSAAAVRAVFDVDVEDPFEQPGPAQARRGTLRVRVIACARGCLLWRSGNDFTTQLRIRRQHAMEAACRELVERKGGVGSIPTPGTNSSHKSEVTNPARRDLDLVTSDL